MRSIRVVEPENGRLRCSVRRAQAGGVIWIALDLRRSPHVALDQDADDVIARRKGRGEVTRFARNQRFGRVSEGDDLFVRLPGAGSKTGDGEWDVAFHFDWEKEPHIYRGSCNGKLDGELSGTIVGDGERKMNFRFSGKFEDGTFSGTHQFVDDEGEAKDSGTLTLSAKH